MIRHCSVVEALALLASPDALEECSLAHGCAALVVEPGEWPEDGLTPAQRRALDWLPCVTVAPSTEQAWRRFDVAAAHADAERVLATITAYPQASLALARLLRVAERSDPQTALYAESVTYGLLQAGPEHAAWPAPGTAERGAPGRVRVERTGDRVAVVLDRPDRHNALDLAMRDGLVDALRAVAADQTIESVELQGEGPSFCSGGDLGDFGTLPDPMTAHLVRSTRLPARAVLAVRRRLTAQVHGSTVGAGVELAAFAGRVVAAPTTTFRLPEVRMGLVPGSGGTWSVTKRVGRQRAAWLALTGVEIDAPTALHWGLVDQVTDRGCRG